MPTPDEGRVLLIHKPLQWTSFDVVNKLRYQLKIRKIGHAGTLDPLATGLLIICTGKKTRDINTFMGLEKEYTGTFVLGQTTPSHDLETMPVPSGDLSSVTERMIHTAANHFIGIQMQVPPAHSAIKVGGKRSYELARKGQEIPLAAREVTIHSFTIEQINLPEVTFRVVCSKGTYIRSLARDFGSFLGVGAYMSSLCRTRIGPYSLDDAMDISSVTSD